jgi:hypothetical protein
LAYVGNYVGSGYEENEGSFFIQVAGDGSDTRVLSAANEFTSRHSTNVANAWRDITRPKAQALFLNGVGGAVNQRQYDIPNDGILPLPPITGAARHHLLVAEPYPRCLLPLAGPCFSMALLDKTR